MASIRPRYSFCLGVAGYPEGHPFISDDLLRKALIDKQRYVVNKDWETLFDGILHECAEDLRKDYEDKVSYAAGYEPPELPDAPTETQ